MLKVNNIRLKNYDNVKSLLDKDIFNNNFIIDYPFKFNMHMCSKQPYQIFLRLNYAYDAFLISMHYILFLSSFFLSFTYGSRIKSRLQLSFARFTQFYPLRLKTIWLWFWLDLKFLLFNSYIDSSIFGLSNLFYIGYVPLSFFNFSFTLSVGFGLKLSPIAYIVNKHRFKFFRRFFETTFDIDFHISLFLSKGMKSFKAPGLISFYRFLVQEYFFIQGMDFSYGSFIKTTHDLNQKVSTISFFKKRYVFKVFKNFKNALVLNLFAKVFFKSRMFKKFVQFYFVYFFKKFYFYLNYFFFFRMVFLYNYFFFFKFFSIFFFKLFFFFGKFFLDFVVVLNMPVFNFFIFFFKKKFGLFFIKFVYFFNFFFNLRFNFYFDSFVKRPVDFVFVPNTFSLKFQHLKFMDKINPFVSLKKGRLNRANGFYFLFFKDLYSLYSGLSSSTFIFFNHMLFIKFFYLLFFYIYKLNFLSSFISFDFYYGRLFFFRILFFNVLLFKKGKKLV